MNVFEVSRKINELQQICDFISAGKIDEVEESLIVDYLCEHMGMLGSLKVVGGPNP